MFDGRTKKIKPFSSILFCTTKPVLQLGDKQGWICVCVCFVVKTGHISGTKQVKTGHISGTRQDKRQVVIGH